MPATSISVKAVSFVALLFALSPTPAGADQTDDFFVLTKDYFARENMVPITAPKGEEPGDIYDGRNNSFLARRDDCFKGLKKPGAVPSNLTHIESKSAVNAGLALSLPVILAASGRNISAKQAEVDFDEVTVASVSLVGLRKAADLKACPFLKSALQVGPGGNANGDEMPIVIGEVISARRIVQLTFADHATASASLLELRKIIPKLGISASADLDAQNDSKVWVRSDQVLPVAYRPIYSREIAERVEGKEATGQPPSPERLNQALINRALGTTPKQVQ
jgi:hypothetical protein